MGEYCAAVELLLARMDSNPEEFSEGGRWERLIARNRAFLPMEDQMALSDKLNTLRLEAFHKEVMSELLAEPRETEEYVWNNTAVPTAASTVPTAVLGAYNNHYAQMQNTLLAGQQASPSTLTNVGAGSPTMNLSRQSIQEIAAQLQSYASNAWKK